MLVGAIRAAVAHRKAGPGDDGDAALTAIRARVPAEHLAEFDDRLHEARLANRLRDERATYSDGWAVGLARRALLEAGRRLAARGALADPATRRRRGRGRARGAAARRAGPERRGGGRAVPPAHDAHRRRRAAAARAAAVAAPAAGGAPGAGPARHARRERRDGQPVRSPRHPELRDGGARARGQHGRLRGTGPPRRRRHRLRPRAARRRAGHADDLALLHRRPAAARRDRHRPGRPAQPCRDRGARVRDPGRRRDPRGHPARFRTVLACGSTGRLARCGYAGMHEPADPARRGHRQGCVRRQGGRRSGRPPAPGCPCRRVSRCPCEPSRRWCAGTPTSSWRCARPVPAAARAPCGPARSGRTPARPASRVPTAPFSVCAGPMPWSRPSDACTPPALRPGPAPTAAGSASAAMPDGRGGPGARARRRGRGAVHPQPGHRRRGAGDRGELGPGRGGGGRSRRPGSVPARHPGPGDRALVGGEGPRGAVPVRAGPSEVAVAGPAVHAPCLDDAQLAALHALAEACDTVYGERSTTSSSPSSTARCSSCSGGRSPVAEPGSTGARSGRPCSPPRCSRSTPP